MKFLRTLLLPLLSILLASGNQVLIKLDNPLLGVSSNVKHTAKTDGNAGVWGKQGVGGAKGIDNLKSNVLTAEKQAKIVGGGKGKAASNTVKNTTIPKNVKIVGDQYLKKNGVNAHELKYEWLGRNVEIKHYDIYRDTKTGELIIFLKKGIGDGINTGKFIK